MASIPAGTQVKPVSRLLAEDQRVRVHPMDWSVPKIDGGYVAALAMAAEALSNLAHDPPSVVFASGPQFANFLAARWLAEAFDAKLVLHYRDEWTVNTPSYVSASDDDRAEELRCLTRADLVGFVSDGKRQIYRAAFPHVAANKLMTVPNGWDPYFHRRARDETQHLSPGKGRFTVTYTGRWHTSLGGFLDMLEQFVAQQLSLAERLRFVFVGNQLPANQALFARFAHRYPNLLLTLPPVAPTCAIEIQRESDALLLINDHVYDGIVPLKTFDYLCGSRPILVYGRGGGAAKVVARLGAGLAIDAGDAAQFGSAITELMRSPSSWDCSARRRWAQENNRATLDRNFLDAIGRLVQGAAEPRIAPPVGLGVIRPGIAGLSSWDAAETAARPRP